METDETPSENTESAEAEESKLPLNRAERRALEQGKKAGGKQSAFGGAGSRPTGGAAGNAGGHGSVRYPRTGHK